MKALIFVHLSSGSVSRKLGCLEYKTYGRKNHSFRFTLVIFTNENDVRLRKSEYIQCNYFLSNIGSLFIQKRNFSYTVCYHVKNAHNIYQPCNLTLLRSIYIVSFFTDSIECLYFKFPQFASSRYQPEAYCINTHFSTFRSSMSLQHQHRQHIQKLNN